MDLSSIASLDHVCPLCAGTVFDIDIARTVRVRFVPDDHVVVDDGDEGDLAWHDDDRAACVTCGHKATLRSMQAPPPAPFGHVAEVTVKLRFLVDGAADVQAAGSEGALAILRDEVLSHVRPHYLLDFDLVGQPTHVVVHLPGAQALVPQGGHSSGA